MTDDRFDIAVIGSGSAAGAFVRAMTGRRDIVVFEPDLVGGECPYVACMPSKAMLHDARIGRTWDEAVVRRNEIVSHLDDGEHADALREAGAVIVRERAEIVEPGVVRAGADSYRVDHIVIATGAEPVFPEIEGLDRHHERVWTSRDALTTSERPDSLIMIGGGVVGSELAYMFAGFGATVTTIDESIRPVEDLHPRVGELVAGSLEGVGVEVLNGVEVARIELADHAASVELTDGSAHRADRLIVATGRAPTLNGLGLDRLGIDPADVDVSDRGALTGVADVWVAGDAAGRDQYTHVANHHGAVIADQLIGDGTRRFGDVVVPGCIFIDPPVIVVGPSWADLRDDGDLVWVDVDVDVPRTSTDELHTGFIAVAARRSTGCIVAANGIGPRFDEIVHALTIAIDGAVPVRRLRQTLQPFPTVGEVLTEVFDRLGTELDG